MRNYICRPEPLHKVEEKTTQKLKDKQTSIATSRSEHNAQFLPHTLKNILTLCPSLMESHDSTRFVYFLAILCVISRICLRDTLLHVPIY